MKHQDLDYRVSLLRAAAFHGSSHQAAMVFQVVAPRQLRELTLGRHRIQFLYQTPRDFEACNRAELLDAIKTPAGFAKVAGAELTLLDCVRYMHRAGGINGVAQIVKDIGSSADPRKLAKAAASYEGASVRRLGYLLELSGHARQANALESFVRSAKSFAPLDPAAKAFVAALADASGKDQKWKLDVNELVEVDA